MPFSYNIRNLPGKLPAKSVAFTLHHNAHNRLGTALSQKHSAVAAYQLFHGGFSSSTALSPSAASLFSTFTLTVYCG